MNRRTAALALFFPLSFLACGSPPPPDEPAPGASPPASASASPPASASAAALPATNAASGSIEERLGKPCTAPQGPAERCTLCDSHGRIAGVVLMGDLVHFDSGTEVFRRSPPPAGVAPNKLAFTMASNAETLRTQVLTCPTCARPMGWGAIVSLASLKDLSPTLRTDLQVALGYPAAPLLDGPAAFKAASAVDPMEALACPGGIRR